MDIKEQVKEKLRELFQFENQDLDFGIYRIMNYKRNEIEKFIEEELINNIRKQLELISEEERRRIEQELNEMSSKNGVKKYLEALERQDYQGSETLKQYFAKDIEEYEKLKNQFEKIKISEDLEKEIYNHLINFFSRYYHEGDFISKRRYGRNERYVVPYNGEETLLYWVNKDQYYIKTTEYFRRYTFKVKTLTVNFRVVSAEEEKANIKSQEKKFFVLADKIFDFDKDNNELNIYFEYRGLTAEEEKKYQHGNSISQDKANEETINILNEKIPQNSPARIIFEKSGEKSYIEKHLYRYTRRNTTDYFIHKDLKGFLERELDFYIKNEFLQLEDLQILEESGYFDKLRLYLIGVRAFRNIALKIIEFLAQIENFQKKLWEKKKFVIDTHYVITLDKIKEYAGEKFLESIIDEILKNKKQLEEWKELFDLEVKTKEDLLLKNDLLEKEWKKLPIDTKYFSEDFKWILLVALTQNNDLDDILDGVLIKSENFQALNLLLNKYYEKVQTIYIDPPFNKEQEADYLYKVGYKDATWITMLENRIRLARDLLNEKGSIFVRCDYNGNMYVRLLLNEIFGSPRFMNENQVNRIVKKGFGANRFPTATDSLFYYTKTDLFLFKGFRKRLRESKEPWWHDMTSMTAGRRGGPPRIIFGTELKPPEGRAWTFSQERIYQLEKEGKIRIRCSVCGYTHYEGKWEGCPKCGENEPRVDYLVETDGKEPIDTDWTDIPGYSFNWDFQTENSEDLLYRVIESTSNEGDLVIDFFLGSGTTTATAHKLKRKWIGIEMGEHFYTVVLPRMKNVLFYDKSGISKEKDVKERYNEKTAGGFFKYHTLEQYEDALENIEFEETQPKLYELPDYFVKYMLEWETKNSNTFLNLEKLKDPFNYKLKVYENYEVKDANTDVVETFNYLLGIKINKYKTLEDNGRKYLFTFGEKDGRKIVIVWRNINDIDLINHINFENGKKIIEKDKEIIEENIKPFEIEEIYLNGDAIVKNFKPIEPVFKSLMFEV
jgi:adenine-specific DNA-methyltransferase